MASWQPVCSSRVWRRLPASQQMTLHRYASLSTAEGSPCKNQEWIEFHIIIAIEMEITIHIMRAKRVA